ncbi:iron-containing alcohol dehydrogenase [Pontiella sulfatireligans]|uniref:Long-chain-alcohol dehydrogenase 2 n=1 Tax=Pontiella sulfatireligans TaxID=2750658 RepID=A0A6C2UI46_9BACT|nr:iron-containing alcohol dehydrogenase [Pontiella sulfatireligans]VGO19875.1 Long-chain-alcohol dehydrogenase 2 [Pontiella sulfatireligans]
MNDFVYENPTKILFGRGVIDQLGGELKRLGVRKVLLVYGGGSIKANGVYDSVIAQLSACGVAVVEHGGVRGNPVLSHVQEGIAKVRAEQIDLICGVGGGSVVDESKAIALGAASDIDVWEFFAKRETPQQALPVMAVLTLPATGSEMNGIAVVTNEETDEKNAIVCPALLNPKVSFMDPETTFSLSLQQTSFACTDILSHLMEGYLTTPAERLLVQDPVIEGVARSVMDSMAVIMKNPSDYDARAAFMWSATLGWSGICQAGIPAWGMPCHALEMPLSAVCDIAHGAGLSIIIPAWMRVAGARHEHRILQFGRRILGLDNPSSVDAVADVLTAYYRSIGSPVSCAEAGIDPDLDRLTNLAFDSFKQRGMHDYTKELITDIYKQSI